MVLLGIAHAAAPPARGADSADVPLLRMASIISGPYGAYGEDGTVWRYFETWQTEVVRKDDGKLVRLDPFDPYAAFDAAKAWQDDLKGGNARAGNVKTIEVPLREASRIRGSVFPPADWTKPEFDDGAWLGTMTPMRMNYRSLALVCLRGKFTVNDPARVTELNLDASVQGGVVIYLNGKEIARLNLPQGRIDHEALADDYPQEAFFGPSGCPIRSVLGGGNQSLALILSEKEFSTRAKDPDLQERYKKRFRHIRLKILPADLRKGVNVLAVEVHRAPAAAGMFTRLFPKETGYDLTDRYNVCWNRAGVEELDLTARAGAGAVVPNIARPTSPQAWNWPTTEAVLPFLYGNPNDGITPIRLLGARNGAFAGQVVVSSPKPITALKAEVTDLSGSGGQIIPKSALRIRYPRFLPKGGAIGFSALEDSVPGEIPCLSYRLPKEREAAIQPVWLTAQVPKDAKPGAYAGTLTVSAEGLTPTAIPVQLSISDWTLPDSQDFQTYNAIIQSPDTLAIRYNVPMWSEEHWKLIDQSFQILGRISAKDLTIPLLRRTHFGNEHGIVRFEKQPDGSFKPQMDILERYIDMAVKHLGKIPTVCFYIVERDDDGCPLITEIDPATKSLKDSLAPAWGTPEALKFWKPVFDGCRRILAKHGMEKAVVLGYHNNGSDGPWASAACLKDAIALVPEARWARLGHMFNCRPIDPKLSVSLERGPGGNPWGRVALVIGGTASVHWDPDTDRPFYGWLNPYPVIGYPREVIVELRDWRMAPEKILFAGMPKAQASWGMCDIAGMFGREKFLGTRGLGPMGADFWAVLPPVQQYGAPQPICGRYIDPTRLWYTVGLSQSITQLVGEGLKGPVSSPMVENLREGLQDAEAHILCQNALLNATSKAKLGPDLAQRCKRVCDDHVRFLRYRSEFSSFGSAKVSAAAHIVFSPAETQEYSHRMFEMAAEVSKAVGK
jgi:hypothetical protein